MTARPFANKMTEVLASLAERTDDDFRDPLLDARGDDRYLLVLVTADKGLCGGFNTNLIKAAQAFIRDNPGKQIEILAVGRKGRDFFRRTAAIRKAGGNRGQNALVGEAAAWHVYWQPDVLSLPEW